MIIRPETPADYSAIRQILIDAFANHPYSHQTEHLIVEALRSASAMTLALVAEIDGIVVGHIAYSVATIGGKECGWWLVGPLAVTPPLQKRGIGSALMKKSMEMLKDRGVRGAVLVGDPNYYTRLGFHNEATMTFEGVPPENLLAFSFDGHYPPGEVGHHAAFFVTAG